MPTNQNDNTKVQQGISDINQAFKERDVQERAKALKIPYMNLIGAPINPDLATVLSKQEAEEGQAAIFFKSGKQVRLGVIDIENPATKKLVEHLKTKGYEVLLSLCSSESMQSAHRIYFSEKYKKAAPIQNVVEEKELGTFEQEIINLEQLKTKIESASYEMALNYVQMGGYKTHATDVHFQPQEKEVLVRFRIDGVLKPVFYLSRKIYDGILKELKQLSHLKLNVTVTPQDGQYVFKVNDRQINVRVSILPTHHGEACVMRLLDSKKTFVSFEELGYQGEALKHVQEAAKLPHGMILVTGPTGSGKTTTMYSMLKSIDYKTQKVITLEDPVEYNLEGITQSQVNAEAGYTFSAGIRAILRQDPDIIMIGEIRDLETAETAAQASLTGHLVISTLHTNSALESIPRLVNMGVKSFILAPALDMIIAQRLVRKICETCAKKRPLSATEKEHIEFTLSQIAAKGLPVPQVPTEIKEASGCDACAHTGYLHQLAIAEVLRFNQELRDMLLEGKSMPQIYDYVNKNLRMITIHEDGILKVIQGLTTLEEVYRVAA